MTGRCYCNSKDISVIYSQEPKQTRNSEEIDNSNNLEIIVTKKQNDQQADINNSRDTTILAKTSSSTITPSSILSSITPVTNQNNQQSDANSNTVVSSQPNKNQTKKHVNSIAEDSITSEVSEVNNSVNLYYNKNQEEFEEQLIYLKAFHNITNEFEVAIWIA
ncbi:hypothetical protein C1645_814306 [Glomus cerebriforme]|uniref:Uncharacterized protein n=1 Tax=Glomus cerebriforme TaxID=658196 RepID=A0A397TG67_9GLOM|nr:hypothetical protein C1645_814306 [Glomus cerebriforme]